MGMESAKAVKADNSFGERFFLAIHYNSTKFIAQTYNQPLLL